MNVLFSYCENIYIIISFLVTVNTERAVTVVETNDEINNNKVIIKKNIVINKESEIYATLFIYELLKDSSSTDIHHYQLL